MRRITLTIILLLSSTAATNVDAASYQKTDGSIVDSIQFYYGGDHWYSGDNLGPGAVLYGAELLEADLSYADLTSAVLSDADLGGVDLSYADLTNADLNYADLRTAYLYGADLTGADLQYADLVYADFDNANLSGANFSAVSYFDESTWSNAYYYPDNEPHWSGSGMDVAWRTSVGILALAPTTAVPEPRAILLALIGLALLPRKRRR